mgnify:CR=1 FL=1
MINLFTNTVRNWKKEQQERRYNFVYKRTYDWFYNIYKMEIIPDSVDLPQMCYYKSAQDKAKVSTERYMAMLVLKGNLNREYAKLARA